MKKLLLLLLTMMVVGSFAETVETRPTISNVQFTTLDGKSYDLHEVLESGKHVYIQTVYNG